MALSSSNFHGTAVSIGAHGVLIIGKPGSGKSDLALRLIDRGAMLISDDCVLFDSDDAQIILRTAQNIAGMIEMRGIGIVEIPHISSAPLKLVVDLNADVPRYLDKLRSQCIAGVEIPHIALAAFECSAVIKVEYALKSVVDQAGT